MRTLTTTLVLLALAAFIVPAAVAQRVRDVPPRPDMGAAADTNSARAYYDHGVRRISANEPAIAAAAFYWASELDPSWSAPLYGRWVALHMTQPRRLVDYWQRNRRVIRSPEVQAIDSIYFRALTIDPFLYRQFEKDLFRLYLMTWIVENRYGNRRVDRAELDFVINRYLRSEAGPYTRGVVAYSEGRFPEALRLWDQELQSARRKAFIRSERGRLFAQIGNDAAALEEFGLALEEMRERDDRDLIFLYESKAILENSRGVLHQRSGNLAAAREAFGQALQEDLAFSPAHGNLALLSLAEGDTASALASLALAVETRGASAQTRIVYAALLLGAGQTAAAAEQLDAAIADAPYFALPYLVRGQVLERLGDSAGARASLAAYLARAARNDPQRATAQGWLEAMDARLGAPTAAPDGR
jgi:predicted negative regulator of RcsB-dependent stress response